jgi:DNA-directed RNA polymerase specialized sigma24 family protein
MDHRAQQAAQERLDGQREGRAFEGLIPFIRRMAGSLSCRLTGEVREDLVGQAITEMWERIGRLPTDARFVPWCRKALLNWMVDELRKQTRRERHEREAARRRPEAGLRLLSGSPELFPERVLAEIDRWPPRQRLVWLCLGELRERVPQGHWERWVAACNMDAGAPMPAIFPPAEWEGVQDGRERVNLLAVLFQVKPETIAQWVCRCRKRAVAIAEGG